MAGETYAMEVPESEQETRELWAEYLSWIGARVEQASNGREAIEMATALRPDVIVMDYCMPEVDGGEAARRLGVDPRTRAIPIILITAARDLLPEGVEERCAAVLDKPMSLDGLLDALEAAVQGVVRARDVIHIQAART